MYEIDDNFSAIPGKCPGVIIQSFTCPEMVFLPTPFPQKGILQILIECFASTEKASAFPQEHSYFKRYD